jgi:hypothetical protein
MTVLMRSRNRNRRSWVSLKIRYNGLPVLRTMVMLAHLRTEG